MSAIRVKDWYIGAAALGRIAPGVYDSEDLALYGAGQYLVANGFAELVEEVVVEDETPTELVEEVVEDEAPRLSRSGRRKDK